MKKLTFLMLALIAMGGILTSCNKNYNKPTATDYTVAYVIKGAADFGYSSCFKYDLKYIDADNLIHTQKNVTGPWDITFTVKTPYTGRIEGKIIYDENELPEENIVFKRALGIGYAKGSNINLDSITLNLETTPKYFDTKAEFLYYANKYPEVFTISKTVEIY